MSYFPIYIDMSNLRVLLVGGGHIATDKLNKLIEFTQEITIIAPYISPESQDLINQHNLTSYTRAYKKGDIKGFDIVIVATDTVILHKEIYEESRESRILVNSVDNTDYCDFIFPSYIKQGDFTLSFSTSGASPAFSKQIRQYFEDKIPKNIDTFLQQMKELRKELPKGKERMKKFEAMTREYIRSNFR